MRTVCSKLTVGILSRRVRSDMQNRQFTRSILYSAFLPALVLQFVAAIFYFVVFANSPSVAQIFTVSKVIMFLWPVVWYAVGVRPRLITQQQTPSMVWGIATGLIAAVVIAIVATVSFGELQQYTGALLQKVQGFGLENHYSTFAIVLSVAHSAFEEYYWRWFVFGGIAQYMQPGTAAWVSSIAFASHHFVVLSQFGPLWLAVLGTAGVLFAGRIWCWLYKRSGTLWASWVSHILADAAVMTLGYVLLF